MHIQAYIKGLALRVEQLAFGPLVVVLIVLLQWYLLGSKLSFGIISLL